MRQKNILLNITDWLVDTASLSDRAQGAYMRLLCHYYRQGEPLAYDEQQLCEMAGYKNVRSLRVVLSELLEKSKFVVVDGPAGKFLSNKRADIEIASYEAKKLSMAEASSRGGKTSRPPAKPVSAPNGADITPISSRYQADFDGQIEENQQVSGSSLSSLSKFTTTTQAQARGPVVAQAPAPARPPEPPKDPFNRRPVVAPPEGTEAYEKWIFRQKLTEIRLEIERLCGEHLNPSAVLHTTMIESWLNAGADAEEHIYPAVRHMVAKAAENGRMIGGIKYFDGRVRGLLDEAKRLAEEAAKPNPSSQATRQPRQTSYGQPAKPKGAVPKHVMQVVKMARENDWTDLHNEMVALLSTADRGDEESLRKLNHLASEHGEMVLTPHSVWLSRKSSAA